MLSTSGTSRSTSVVTASAGSAFVDVQDQASLREKQACSELLDWVAKFCGPERSGTEDATTVTGMMNPPYHAPVRAPISLALPWHSSVKIADRNYNIVMGYQRFFLGHGLLHYSLESYIPKPESEIIPSRPPPTE